MNQKIKKDKGWFFQKSNKVEKPSVEMTKKNGEIHHQQQCYFGETYTHFEF